MTARRFEAGARTWTVVCSVILVAGLFGTMHRVFGIPWPVAPQNTAHPINKTYGDWNGYHFHIDTLGCHIAYHTAVDIPTDSGTAVLAVFDGYVTDAKTFTDTLAYLSYITIARTLGGNPSWHCGHLLPLATLGKDSTVSYGDTLGYVAPFTPNLSNCHLHFYLEEEVGNLTESVCNPLDSLLPAPSQNVMIATRNLTANHPYLIKYVKDGVETIVLAETLWDSTLQEFILRDSVDLVAAAMTGVQGDYRPGIYGIGYSVTPVDSGSAIPYRSMLEMRGPFEVADSLEYYATYVDPDSVIITPLCRYIITNCGDSLPSPTKGISNVEENCRPTRVDTSGTGTAQRNREARCEIGLDKTWMESELFWSSQHWADYVQAAPMRKGDTWIGVNRGRMS